MHPLSTAAACEESSRAEGQPFLIDGEKEGLFYTKTSFATHPWGCRSCVTFPGTLNVLLKRLLWQEPRSSAQRDSLVSHGSPALGRGISAGHVSWRGRRGNVVSVGRWFGFILGMPTSEPKPNLTACSVWPFVYFSYNLIRLLTTEQLKRLGMSTALHYLSSQLL